MYICRIRARGLIARPTLQLHWGCVQTLPHTLHPAPAAAAPRQGFCATQLPLKLLPLLHFDSPAHRKKNPTTATHIPGMSGVWLSTMTWAAS